MSQVLEIKVDDQGHILISEAVRHRLGLNPGMKLVVERADADNVQLSPQPESPRLIDEGGVLVAETKLLTDVDDFIRQERNRRSADVIGMTSS